MTIKLYPELSDLTREEIEAHIELVRARRVVAALEYVAGQNLKLTYEAEKIQKKIKMAYERLGRAIQKLDAADEQVQKHMIEIEELKQELGFTVSQVTVTEKDDDV
jgi:enoyl-[acyl-carrier-protein] reductase (NADH)